MLVAAALIPDTALLVPGAAGGVTGRDGDPARRLRRAADEAVGAALEGAGRVVVVAPGRTDRFLAPPLRGSLAAAGVPDDLLWWPPPGVADASVPGVSASVALFLLSRHVVAHHRANRDAAVLEVAPPDAHDERHGTAALRARGAEAVAPGPTALVVVGSPSGRHGPDAPLADDERAPGYDDGLLADLADAGTAARDRLAALDPELARELAVTGWGPWQVLLGAAGRTPTAARLLRREVLAGATHAVLVWRSVP